MNPVIVLKPVAAWLAATMVMAAPPGRRHYLPEAIETKEQALERYEAIASTIAKVSFDPAEQPVFPGSMGRTQTATLILGLSYSESGWRRDVDLGLGKEARGDFGRSWCMMQINLGSKRVFKDGKWQAESAAPTKEGWWGSELVADREKCFRAGLHIIRLSVNACRSLPYGQWLNAYASGTCSGGKDKSEARMALARRWYTRTKPPWKDAELIALLVPESVPVLGFAVEE